ncbi:MAG: phosphotransferase [Actinomycetota bacterium]|nr:phosphotransferase [Actinomycetota bacterium]
MEHARRHGYPVPRVAEVTSDALVLDRIEGPTMLEELRRRPWRLGRHASLLARLHEQLHEIAAPPSLPAVGPGERLLHLDLHPGNVILSPRGPFVIDWTNARRGDPAVDIALTSVIVATSGGLPGRLTFRWFLRQFDRDDLLRGLPAAAELRLADANVSERERRAIRRFVRRRAP